MHLSMDMSVKTCNIPSNEVQTALMDSARAVHLVLDKLRSLSDPSMLTNIFSKYLLLLVLDEKKT